MKRVCTQWHPCKYILQWAELGSGGWRLKAKTPAGLVASLAPAGLGLGCLGCCLGTAASQHWPLLWTAAGRVSIIKLDVAYSQPAFILSWKSLLSQQEIDISLIITIVEKYLLTFLSSNSFDWSLTIPSSDSCGSTAVTPPATPTELLRRRSASTGSGSGSEVGVGVGVGGSGKGGVRVGEGHDQEVPDQANNYTISNRYYKRLHCMTLGLELYL